MLEAALRRMVRGVSTRDYAGLIDAARESFGIRRSSVNPAFIEGSRQEVEELMRSRFDGVRFPAIFIDGVEYADTTMVVALGLMEDGQKRILGFREGASENAEVCKSLVDDLCERGLCRDQATRLVLDGSKAIGKRSWRCGADTRSFSAVRFTRSGTSKRMCLSVIGTRFVDD